VAMGKREGEQEDLFVTHQQLRAQSHPFYRAVNRILSDEGFDRYVERLCSKFYAKKMGPLRTGAGPRHLLPELAARLLRGHRQRARDRMAGSRLVTKGGTLVAKTAPERSSRPGAGPSSCAGRPRRSRDAHPVGTNHLEAITRKRVGPITESAASSGPNGSKSWQCHRAAIAHNAIQIRRFRAIGYTPPSRSTRWPPPSRRPGRRQRSARRPSLRECATQPGARPTGASAGTLRRHVLDGCCTGRSP
jgi:hypothetical protein